MTAYWEHVVHQTHVWGVMDAVHVSLHWAARIKRNFLYKCICCISVWSMNSHRNISSFMSSHLRRAQLLQLFVLFCTKSPYNSSTDLELLYRIDWCRHSSCSPSCFIWGLIKNYSKVLSLFVTMVSDMFKLLAFTVHCKTGEMRYWCRQIRLDILLIVNDMTHLPISSSNA